jgi:phosphotransferase system enzyme I (PtsI)
MSEPPAEKRCQGVGVSPGIARGTVFVHRPQEEEPPLRKIEESEVPAEIARLEAALILTRAQIVEMQAKDRRVNRRQGREHF